MKEFSDFVRMEGLSLNLGDTKAVDCPLCKGSKKFYVTRVDEGLLYNCFKASCPLRGFVRSKTAPREMHLRTKKIAAAEKPSVIGVPLPSEVREELEKTYYMSQYHIDKNIIRYQHPHVVFHLFDLSGEIIGVSKKILKKFVPRFPQYNKHFYNTYSTSSNPSHKYGVYFPRTMKYKGSNTCVLVEGWMDAIRVGDYMPCGALLGVNLQMEAAQLLKRNFDNLVVFLDPDTKKNFAFDPQAKLREKYSGMFNSIEFITHNSLDPKDIPPKDLRDMLSAWN